LPNLIDGARLLAPLIRLGITNERKNLMLNDKERFLADIRKNKVGGVILWRGKSLINGEPIVAVACKIADANKSTNAKTGAMVQTFILPDPKPHGIECNGNKPAKIKAWLEKTGARSICGDCPHAWQWSPSEGKYKKGSCYVREYQSPAAVLGAVYRESYPVAGVDFPRRWVADIVEGLAVRLGSYGDPAAVPAAVWARLVSKAKNRTGYTHQWDSAYDKARTNAFYMRSFVMASCDSVADYNAATREGFRAFLVTPRGDASPRKNMILCPASSDFEKLTNRKTSCDKCGLCSGAMGKGENKKSVFIPAHGATANRV